MTVIEWPVTLPDTKYSRWYNNLIEKSKNRKLQGYTEKHHIIPRSFGGSNDAANIAVLTAREHYIAHWLLWKMNFPQPYYGKMAAAFKTFCGKLFYGKKRTTNHNYKINSKMYERLRVECAAYQSEFFSGENASWYGRKHTEESKKLIGEKSKLKTFKSGPDNPRWGQKMPPGFGKKISDRVKEKWTDPEWRARQVEIRKEVSNRPEVKEKHAAFNKERWANMDLDDRKSLLDKSLLKAIDERRGKTWDEIYTPEQIERMQDAIANREISEDAKIRIKEGQAKGCRAPMPAHVKAQMSVRFTGIKRPTKICIHCGKTAVVSNINRWHNDNCKHKK